MDMLLASGPLFGLSSDGRGIIVFGLEIYYYAIVIVSGMVIAAALSALLMKRRNMSPDLIYTLFLFCIPSAIIGARLFYCITDGMPIKQWIDIRDGGLSIIGGVLGGVLAGYVVCKVKKINFLRAADCVVVNILLAQALGRWGNFFNAEVYGGKIVNEALQWFPFGVPISSNSDLGGVPAFFDSSVTWHYAFFFYESVLNLIGWAILFTYTWFRKKKPNGLPICLYFIWYGVVRTAMEPLRDPQYILSANGVPWSLLFSILQWGIGTIAALLLLLNNYRKEGSFLGSAKGDPCGITAYLTPNKGETPYFSRINMLGSNYPPAPPKEKKSKKKTTQAASAEEETPEEKRDEGES